MRIKMTLNIVYMPHYLKKTLNEDFVSVSRIY